MLCARRDRAVSNELTSTGRASLVERVQELATDAIVYWEPRRLVFNGVLAVIVAVYFVIGWPNSRSALSLDMVFLVIILAVLANICYCLAYLVDVFIQLSGFRELWRNTLASLCPWPSCRFDRHSLVRNGPLFGPIGAHSERQLHRGAEQRVAPDKARRCACFAGGR